MVDGCAMNSLGTGGFKPKGGRTSKTVLKSDENAKLRKSAPGTPMSVFDFPSSPSDSDISRTCPSTGRQRTPRVPPRKCKSPQYLKKAYETPRGKVLKKERGVKRDCGLYFGNQDKENCNLDIFKENMSGEEPINLSLKEHEKDQQQNVIDNADAAPGKSELDAQRITCPLCETEFDINLTTEEREAHVNNCLDKCEKTMCEEQINTDEALAASLQREAWEKETSLEDVSSTRKGTLREKPVRKGEFRKDNSENSKKKKTLTNKEDKNRVVGKKKCPICSKAFSNNVDKFSSHLRQCAVKHKVPTSRLLYLLKEHSTGKSLSDVEKSNASDAMGACNVKSNKGIVLQQYGMASKNRVVNEIKQHRNAYSYSNDLSSTPAFQVSNLGCFMEKKEAVVDSSQDPISGISGNRIDSASLKTYENTTNTGGKLWDLTSANVEINAACFYLSELHAEIKVLEKTNIPIECNEKEELQKIPNDVPQKNDAFTCTQYEKLDILVNLNDSLEERKDSSDADIQCGFIYETYDDKVDQLQTKSVEAVRRNMESLLQSSSQSDMVFHCKDGVDLPAHKLIVSNNCEYLKQLIHRGVSEIDVTDVSANAVGAILKYIYAGVLPLYDEECIGIYKLSTRFELHLLKDLCLVYMPELTLSDCETDVEFDADKIVKSFWGSDQGDDINEGTESLREGTINDSSFSDDDFSLMQEASQFSQVGRNIDRSFKVNDSKHKRDSDSFFEDTLCAGSGTEAMEDNPARKVSNNCIQGDGIKESLLNNSVHNDTLKEGITETRFHLSSAAGQHNVFQVVKPSSGEGYISDPHSSTMEGRVEESLRILSSNSDLRVVTESAKESGDSFSCPNNVTLKESVDSYPHGATSITDGHNDIVTGSYGNKSPVTDTVASFEQDSNTVLVADSETDSDATLDLVPSPHNNDKLSFLAADDEPDIGDEIVGSPLNDLSESFLHETSSGGGRKAVILEDDGTPTNNLTSCTPIAQSICTPSLPESTYHEHIPASGDGDTTMVDDFPFKLDYSDDKTLVDKPGLITAKHFSLGNERQGTKNARLLPAADMQATECSRQKKVDEDVAMTSDNRSQEKIQSLLGGHKFSEQAEIDFHIDPANADCNINLKTNLLDNTFAESLCIANMKRATQSSRISSTVVNDTPLVKINEKHFESKLSSSQMLTKGTKTCSTPIKPGLSHQNRQPESSDDSLSGGDSVLSVKKFLTRKRPFRKHNRSLQSVHVESSTDETLSESDDIILNTNKKIFNRAKSISERPPRNTPDRKSVRTYSSLSPFVSYSKNTWLSPPVSKTFSSTQPCPRKSVGTKRKRSQSRKRNEDFKALVAKEKRNYHSNVSSSDEEFSDVVKQVSNKPSYSVGQKELVVNTNDLNNSDSDKVVVRVQDETGSDHKHPFPNETTCDHYLPVFPNESMADDFNEFVNDVKNSENRYDASDEKNDACVTDCNKMSIVICKHTDTEKSINEDITSTMPGLPVIHNLSVPADGILSKEDNDSNINSPLSKNKSGNDYNNLDSEEDANDITLTDKMPLPPDESSQDQYMPVFPNDSMADNFNEYFIGDFNNSDNQDKINTSLATDNLQIQNKIGQVIEAVDCPIGAGNSKEMDTLSVIAEEFRTNNDIGSPLAIPLTDSFDENSDKNNIMNKCTKENKAILIESFISSPSIDEALVNLSTPSHSKAVSASPFNHGNELQTKQLNREDIYSTPVSNAKSMQFIPGCSTEGDIEANIYFVNKSLVQRCENFGPGSDAHPETNEPITPMPDYSAFPTPALKGEMKKFAIRGDIPKYKMVAKMNEIYKYQHQFQHWEGEEAQKPKGKRKAKPKKDQKNNDAKQKNITKKDNSVDNSSQSNSDSNSRIADNSKSLNEQLTEYIFNNSELHYKVLTYTPLEFTILYTNLKSTKVKCSRKELEVFLDTQCICYYTAKDDLPQPKRRRGRTA